MHCISLISIEYQSRIELFKIETKQWEFTKYVAVGELTNSVGELTCQRSDLVQNTSISVVIES